MDVLGVILVFAALGVVIYFAKKAYDKHVDSGYGAVNTDVAPATPNVVDVQAGTVVSNNDVVEQTHEYESVSETNKSI